MHKINTRGELRGHKVVVYILPSRSALFTVNTMLLFFFSPLLPDRIQGFFRELRILRHESLTNPSYSLEISFHPAVGWMSTLSRLQGTQTVKSSACFCMHKFQAKTHSIPPP